MGILSEAADLLSECGWWQRHGPRRGPNGEYCVVDAIKEVAGSDNSKVLHRAIKRATRTAGAEIEGLDRWDNTPGRTKTEVVKMLRGADNEPDFTLAYLAAAADRTQARRLLFDCPSTRLDLGNG
jgi:hypothetical protein